MAHVDHGKTTLTDSLLAYQGIISYKQAGQLRYLDSRPDEQQRGITMKSSAITLPYRNHVIHMVDSPGHIDFYGQVSSAAKLCDGCILMIDVVEGLCSQSLSAFRLAYDEHLYPVLFLNKLDRLITELLLSPLETYNLLVKLLEQVNAFCSIFRKEDIQEEEQHLFYFDPKKGNVLFGSALDGWAFNLNTFVNLYHQKFPFLSKYDLLNGLWGNFTIKYQKIVSTEKIPLFVQMILENIYIIYRSSLSINSNVSFIESIITKLNLAITSRDLKNRDRRALLRTIMTTWISLSNLIYETIIDKFPSPTLFESNTIIQIGKMIPPLFDLESSEKKALLKAHGIIQSLHSLSIQEFNPKRNMIAMCRVYSGSLSIGDELLLIYSSSKLSMEQHQEEAESSDLLSLSGIDQDYRIKKVKINHLFKLFGTEFIPIDSVSSGHIFGIDEQDLQVVSKSGILTDSRLISESIKKILVHTCSSMIKPLFQVSIEPLDLSNLISLQNALWKLYQSDPSAQIDFLATGELILSTCGELHLQQCILDLKEKYIGSSFDIRVSDPIVPFRETIRYKDINDYYIMTPTAKAYMKDIITCKVKILNENVHITTEYIQTGATESCKLTMIMQVISLSEHVINGMNNHSNSYRFKKYGSNIIWMNQDNNKSLFKEWETFILAGFQLAADAGPICGEPMMEIGFIVHFMSLSYDSIPQNAISIMRNVFLNAFLARSPRIAFSMNKVEIQAPQDSIGKVYTLINKCHGRVVSEEFKQDTGYFVIITHIPMMNCFGFADELRAKTSGTAFPIVTFSGFEVLYDEDPFWMPMSREEIEKHGEKISGSNPSLECIIKLRKQKVIYYNTNNSIITSV